MQFNFICNDNHVDNNLKEFLCMFVYVYIGLIVNSQPNNKRSINFETQEAIFCQQNLSIFANWWHNIAGAFFTSQLAHKTEWPTSVAQLDARLTDDQEVADARPAELATLICGVWSWNVFYVHSLFSADSRWQLSVYGKRMCIILVNLLED